jgi:flagellar hook-associated protein 3 FlgL
VFQSSQDIFQTLIGIRDDLLAGDQSSLQNARLTELDVAREQFSQAQSRVGAVQNRLDRTELEIEDFQVQLQELLSDSIDADFAEVLINLNAQSNAFQAALSAAARAIQPSLLDFI